MTHRGETPLMFRVLIPSLALSFLASPLAAQQQGFCPGLFGAIAGVVVCPEKLDEIGAAQIGVVCVGVGGQPPKMGGDQLEAQVRSCLPPDWQSTALREGQVANRPARFREYVRRADGRRLAVGEFLYVRQNNPRAAPVEFRQAFIAVPPL